MIDRVRYRAPGGALGRVVEQLVLDAYLRDLIQRRNEWLRTTLEP